MNVRKIGRKSIRYFLFLAALLVCFTVPAGKTQASETPDVNRKGSILVTLRDADSGNGISGAKFSVYRVAEIQVNGADYTFQYIGAYSSVSTDPSQQSNLNASLARELAQIAAGQQATAELTTGTDGSAKFENMDTGLYVVVQTGTSGSYVQIDPFLVTIPMEDSNGALTYDVDTYPKHSNPSTQAPTETIQESTSPTTPNAQETTVTIQESTSPTNPNAQETTVTIDESTSPTTANAATTTEESSTSSSTPRRLPQTGQLWWPVMFLALAGILLVGLGVFRKEHDHEKKD